jgi:hypothetical protein
MVLLWEPLAKTIHLVLNPTPDKCTNMGTKVTPLFCLTYCIIWRAISECEPGFLHSDHCPYLTLAVCQLLSTTNIWLAVNLYWGNLPGLGLSPASFSLPCSSEFNGQTYLYRLCYYPILKMPFSITCNHLKLTMTLKTVNSLVHRWFPPKGTDLNVAWYVDINS